MKVFEYITDDSKQSGAYLARVGYWMCFFEVVYPPVVLAIVRVHSATTSKDLSERAISHFLQLSLLVCFSCVVSLVFCFRGEGSKRIAGIVCSAFAGALNLFFLLSGVDL